jgi:hypothetical protein
MAQVRQNAAAMTDMRVDHSSHREDDSAVSRTNSLRYKGSHMH